MYNYANIISELKNFEFVEKSREARNKIANLRNARLLVGIIDVLNVGIVI